MRFERPKRRSYRNVSLLRWIWSLVFVISTIYFVASFWTISFPVPSSPPLLGAYYYAWYEPRQWSTWKTRYQPQLGLYNSSDHQVLSQHSKWAHQAGLDFFITSYSGRPGDFVKEYLQHPDTIPMALHIESLMLYWDTRVNRTQPSNGLIDFEEPCQHRTGNLEPFGRILIDTILDLIQDVVLPYRHKYLFVSHRQPVFVLYLAREFVNFESYIQQLRLECQQRFGIEPYLIADVVWFIHDKRVKRNTQNHGKDLWNAITAYNRYEGRKDESLHQYLNRMQAEYRTYANPTRAWYKLFPTHRIPVIPYVQPGYDDLLIRSHEHGKGIERPVYPRENQRTYNAFWELALRVLRSNPCESFPFVFVTSFNEWHESTAVEPSSKWGEAYLDTTNQWVRRLRDSNSCNSWVSPFPV